ncbi:MAG: carboxypeptidase regulatory-like domain-containing protein [Gemmatimonadetes bacterium]|nr:carboxypeptidase regulatory-like domain-containing protein [Gemmatimonadota bacterium]
MEISGFDAGEIGFSSTSGAATVGVGESKVVSFDGTYLRTAGIVGQVSVDGEGLAGVTVTLSGHGEDATEVTDAGGLYSFSKLRSGTYQVAISGYDTDDYEFEVTSKSATIATGETANVPFEGTLLRTAGIAGRVSVAGMGLDGVAVTLAGAAEATTETSNGGQYAFAGLAAGTYVVSIANPNDVAYNFETTSTNVELMDDQSAIVNFDGTHTRTASVTGMMYLDEAPQDKMYTANEPALAHAGIPVALQGPGINDVAVGVTMDDGSFAFEELTAGSYRVLVNMTDEVAAAIETAGFAFAGDLTGTIVNVTAGGNAQVNFPFRITTQTLVAGARMGNADEVGAPVAGVELALYANADMTGMLGEATTDDMGMATFDFARADNTGPTGNDNIVFVKVKATGHDALVVSENDFTEVSYAATERASSAPAAAKLVNVMANFQFWVKSDADARGGDMGLSGWKTHVYMGDPEADDAMPLMMVDEDGDTVNATMPTDDGEDNMADLGKGTFSYTVDPADLPAMFSVSVADGQSSERYETSDALTFTHTGLVHPEANTAEMNDLGPIYVTWTTQALTVGVYREVDDEPGFSDYRAPLGGDDYPDAAVAAEMMVELLTRDSRNRLRRYDMWDDDRDAKTDPVDAVQELGKNGMASFGNLPAGVEFTARLHVGDDRMLVGETDVGDVEAFGDDLDLGMSMGSFGDASGAGPEVKLCSVSTDMKKCATWAYQWTTGSVSGSVAGPGGADVTLAAETNARDRSTKTGADSKKDSYRMFAISDIQDGEYALTTPNTADNSFSPKGGHELEIYHNETEDDEDDDTEYVGTASAHTANFTATKLRLAIKGFVANDNGDGRARGNEAMAGVMVNLLKAASAKDTAYTVVAATAETDGNGMYEFNDLAEGAKYRVAVVAGDDYAGLRSLKVAKTGVVNPAEYPAIEEPFTGLLPSWDHASNMASGTATTASNATGTVRATLQNFALVYRNGTVSGSVTNLSGANAGVIVEAAHCIEYTPASDGGTPDDAADDTPESCTWGEIMRTESAGKSGDYEFSGLLEGYHQVWFTGGGLMAAQLVNGMPDDDVPATGDPVVDTIGSHTAMVMGRDQYDTGNNFYVYNARASTADALTELTVEEFQADGDTVDLGADDVSAITQDASGTNAVNLTDNAIEFASGGIAIDAEASQGATVRATIEADGFSVSNLPFNKTGTADAGTAIATTISVTVTAANGFNDHVYTLAITRAAPRSNVPTTVTADAATVTWAANGYHDQNVAAASTSSDIVVDLLPGQSLAVTVGGNAVSCEAGTADATVHTCAVATPVGQTSAKIEVTSEDGVAASMLVNFRRPSS